jgi:hypothetical protein
MIGRKPLTTTGSGMFGLSRRLKRYLLLTDSAPRTMHETKRAILKKLARRMRREQSSSS